jgi:hypothetical protein
MSTVSEFSDDALIAELARRRPDLILVPRVASKIMAMRGTQETCVFEREANLDIVSDYLNLSEVGEVVGYADRSGVECDVDERPWLIAAAVWRGCLKGFEEWERYRAKEGETPMVLGWLRACELHEPQTPGVPDGQQSLSAT